MTIPVLARAVDAGLEATIAGSFTTVGYRARRRLFGWDEGSPDMARRTVVVTGATSGLGRATAFELAGLGARVVVVGRDPQRTQQAVDDIRDGTGNGEVEAVIADLADLAAVADAADRIAASGPVDALINNAGALTREFVRTGDGMELTYQTHVVAPFLLVQRLLPALQERPGSRVVTVSSGGMYAEPLHLDTLQMGPEDYDGVRAYARAKRAQVVLNQEWARRTEAPPAFHAMHPGWADTPGVVHSLPTFHRVVGRFLRTPQEGADTIIWLASAPDAASGSGGFWLDRRRRGVAYLPWTRTDAATAAALWERVNEDARVVGAQSSR